jgi:predicted negative regulator of RcsB-dependent stress response
LAKFYIERAIDNLEKGQDASVMLDHLGDILWKMGDKTKAMENWKKAFETDKTNENLRLKIENKGM